MFGEDESLIVYARLEKNADGLFVHVVGPTAICYRFVSNHELSELAKAHGRLGHDDCTGLFLVDGKAYRIKEK